MAQAPQERCCKNTGAEYHQSGSKEIASQAKILGGLRKAPPPVEEF
jgi:hypothetical protein